MTDVIELTALCKSRSVIAIDQGGDYGIASYYLLAGLVSDSVGIIGLISDCYQRQRHVMNLLSDNDINIEERNGAVFAKKSGIIAFDIVCARHSRTIRRDTWTS